MNSKPPGLDSKLQDSGMTQRDPVSKTKQTNLLSPRSVSEKDKMALGIAMAVFI